MSIEKFAAALHAFADALLADVEEGVAKVETAVKGKGKGKTATPTPAAAATPAAASAQAAPSTAAAAPVVAEAAAPPASTLTIKDVNALVLKVAAKNRDGAVALLGKFGLSSTVGLPHDKWQLVYDAFEEELAKQDAAAVQVAQASLV